MSETKEAGGPAFPSLETFQKWDEEAGRYRDETHPSGGMTLRDYLAASALPSVIDAYIAANGPTIGSDHAPSNCSIIAYKFADAMLKARASA